VPAKDCWYDCFYAKTRKPLSEFGKSSGTKHGYWVYCKPCSYERHNRWRLDNLPHVAAEQAKRRKKFPERYKDYHRKKNYDLPAGEYDRMLSAQGGQCAICKTSDPKGKGSFHVDHCHETDRIRGLLCHNCNVGLGHLQHRSDLLESAISYLKLSPESGIKGAN
jgi:hypothetical protein